MPEAPYDLIATLFFMSVALGAVLYSVIGRLASLEEDMFAAKKEINHLHARLAGEEFRKERTNGETGEYRASGGSRPGKNGRR